VLKAKSIGMIGVAVGLLLACASGALAQSAGGAAPPAPAKTGPDVWDTNHDGVYTCEEWKSYLDRMFVLADRNHDGHLDAKEFDAVRKAAPALADADFGYFDENQDGKITRNEFVAKPSEFILKYDRNGDCRVTPEEIRAGNTPPAPQGPTERPRDRFHYN
jgi:EF-hand domain pair